MLVVFPKPSTILVTYKHETIWPKKRNASHFWRDASSPLLVFTPHQPTRSRPQPRLLNVTKKTALHARPQAIQIQQDGGPLPVRRRLFSHPNRRPALHLPLPLHRVPKAILIRLWHQRHLPRHGALSPRARAAGKARVLDTAQQGREDNGLLLLQGLRRANVSQDPRGGWD